jgi:CRP-like cAMP-binding protein
VAAQEQMLLLGRKTARARLASYLLAQSHQGMPRGHSRQRFTLPMTRVDIASRVLEKAPSGEDLAQGPSSSGSSG